jgi:enoyl-CoA hydratase/carnithine racemase
MDSVLYREFGSVGYLSLNRPPKNELTVEMFERLGELFFEKSARLNLKGFIISGEGRHFSSGADVDSLKKALLRGNEWDRDRLSAHLEVFKMIEDSDVPVVAAVKGVCLGAGMELAMACSYRLASRNAIFALPEAELGIMPGCGGTIRLPHLVGKGTALELVLSGRRLLAEEAVTLGLADILVERSELLSVAKTLIDRVSDSFFKEAFV